MARLSSVLQPVLQSVYHHNTLFCPGAVGHLLVQNYSFDFDLERETFDLMWPFRQKISVCRFVKVKTVGLHVLYCRKTTVLNNIIRLVVMIRLCRFIRSSY